MRMNTAKHSSATTQHGNCNTTAQPCQPFHGGGGGWGVQDLGFHAERERIAYLTIVHACKVFAIYVCGESATGKPHEIQVHIS